jgi:hypothetical protein
MAERAVDSNDKSCFIDDNSVYGWVDDDGNWLGYKFDSGDAQCVPDGFRNFRCVFS